MVIKQVKLDICNGFDEIVNIKGERPTIEHGMNIEVLFQGFPIDLKVNTLLTPPRGKYIGVIASLSAGKEKYGDLNVGDSIIFEKKICPWRSFLITLLAALCVIVRKL